MANHGCVSNPCPVCHPVQYDRRERLAEGIARFLEEDDDAVSEPTNRDEARDLAAKMLWAWGWYDLAEHLRSDRPCSCHKPKHEARKPSPLTMIGRQ